MIPQFHTSLARQGTWGPENLDHSGKAETLGLGGNNSRQAKLKGRQTQQWKTNAFWRKRVAASGKSEIGACEGDAFSANLSTLGSVALCSLCILTIAAILLLPKKPPAHICSKVSLSNPLVQKSLFYFLG